MSAAALLHGIVVLAGVVAYTLLTALGHDGNTVLAATIAYGGGAVVESKAPSATVTL